MNLQFKKLNNSILQNPFSMKYLGRELKFIPEAVFKHFTKINNVGKQKVVPHLMKGEKLVSNSFHAKLYVTCLYFCNERSHFLYEYSSLKIYKKFTRLLKNVSVFPIIYIKRFLYCNIVQCN